MTRNRWLWLLFSFVFAALVLACAFHFDPQVQRWIAEHQSRGAIIFMRNVSRIGDWPTHAALGLASMAIAYWRGRKKWVRIFAAMLLACALAGVSARAVKIATGRARPLVKAEAAWSGPHFGAKYNAFPSGHTAASTAFFTTLFFASRRLGLAFLPIPLLIALSRMYVAAHYLSDVTFAALLGVACAVLMARWFLVPSANHQSSIEN